MIPMKADRRTAAQKGGTLIDVLLAMIILSTFGVMLMQSLTTAARLGRHCNRLSAASILASNESERIKTAAAYTWYINDTSYTTRIQGTEYRVVRATLPRDLLKNRYATGVNQEIEIRVGMTAETDPLLKFRVLQGHR
jgi:type II secretory pathway pseudopilin PulG